MSSATTVALTSEPQCVCMLPSKAVCIRSGITQTGEDHSCGPVLASAELLSTMPSKPVLLGMLPMRISPPFDAERSRMPAAVSNTGLSSIAYLRPSLCRSAGMLFLHNAAQPNKVTDARCFITSSVSVYLECTASLG